MKNNVSASLNPQFWQDRPVFVTGATGLLGNWVVKQLLHLGADVVCLVREWVPQSEMVRQKLIEKVNAVNWKDRVMPGGFNGEVGLKLDQLEAVVEQALCQYEVSNYKIDHVEVTHADATALKMFRHALAANEKNGRDYILIHFLQDVVTDAQGGPYPHISPIGAYDETSKRVLIMDVDREWYEPYWVSDERLLLAMSKKTERYGLGGYVWIRPKS